MWDGDANLPAVQDLRPIVVIGPSGVGKGTLIGRLMERHSFLFGFAVSHTTRAPRPGEQDGVHYHFVTRDTMTQLMSEGKFLETAEVHGNLYGTSVQAVRDVKASNKTAVLDIDVQGARQVMSGPYGSQSLLVFIAPPSMEELEKRLRGRGTEDEEKIKRRLMNAQAEMAASKEPGFVHHIIVNDDVDTAYSELESVISAHLPELRISPTPKTSATGKPVANSETKLEDPQSSSQMKNNTPNGCCSSKSAAREYLQDTVVPHIEGALVALVESRPSDPLQFVIDHLQAKRAQL